MSLAYVAFWLDPAPSFSELQSTVEFYSFFVMPFVWAGLIFLGLRTSRRQDLTPGWTRATKVALVMSSVCCAAAVAVAALLATASIVFWWTDF